MRVSNFSILIPEGRERDTGHVSLDHGRQFSIKLGNSGHVRCDAEVEVDGKPVGAFRLNAGSSMVLERPVHDTGRFTFFRADSSEAEKVGAAAVAREDRGLVQVRFKPERKVTLAPVPITMRGEVMKGPRGQSGDMGSTPDCVGEDSGVGVLREMGFGFSSSSHNVAAGVTGLTGQSNQSFYSVSALDYDPAGETTITLRLVTPAPRSNPIPEAV